MKTKFTSSLLLSIAFLLAFTGIKAQQPQQLVHFWDFNNSVPTKSPGGDSLGTYYAYGHTFTQDTTIKTGTLYADYTRIPSAKPQMVYTRPHAIQSLPLVATLRDSILDNGNGGAFYYDYSGSQFNYFNVSDSSIGGNNYVRTRNPSENTYLYIYASTAGWKNIHLYYALSASSTKGAKFNIFSYSCDSGVTWNKLVAGMDTFNVGHHPYYDSMQAVNPTTAASLWYPVQINFSPDVTTNNNRKFVLRIQSEGTSSNGTSGNDRYDNFAFTGDSNTANIVSYIVRRQNVGPCWGDSNGSARVYVSGGTAPFSYSWSNNATNSHGAGGLTTDSAFGLKAGTYTVTVTDFLDNASQSVVTILQPTEVIASIAGHTNVSCNGGSNGTINSSVAGGTSPYTYSWSNGKTTANITGLSIGTYTLTVTDHLGCTSPPVSQTITQPTIISIITSNTPVTCVALGTAMGTPSGGTPHIIAPNYAYSWSNGATTATATGLGAGTYTVTVTDSLGCSETASTTVTSSGANVVLTPTPLTCNGSNNGSIVSNVTGGSPPYTYNWSNGATTTSINGLTAGIYTLTIHENNGCIDNANTTVTQPAVLKDTIVAVSIPVEVIDYWDFNLTPPIGGAGGDSLGNNVNPLPADFTAIPANHPHITFSHTPADGIMDNLGGPPEAYVNDLPICGNDSAGQAINNVGVRTRNPTTNSAFYWYIPTTGYDNIKVDWALSASSTKGAQYLVFQYSTNGGVSWNRLTGAMDTFNTGGHFHPDSLNGINPITAASNWYPVHIDFSSAQAVNNNPNVVLKITYAGAGIGGASGNNRFDNISVRGQQVPKVSCHNGNNGSGQADVSGGTPPFTYSWSNGATTSSVNNLVPGIATVTVTDANGCSVTASVNVINPPPIVDSLSVNDGCNNSNNGSILSIPSGGTGPYVWSWQGGSTSNMITGLTPNTYSVTVTDVNGCTVTANATVTNPAVLLANATFTGITCNGLNNGTANSAPTGGTSPYKYKWSAGAGGSTSASVSGLHPGTDSVTVTDADGCTATASVIITQPSSITDSISAFTEELCNGGNTATATAGITGGTGPYTYSWAPNGGNGATASNLTAGSYTVTMNDANGCGPVTANITITEPTALSPVMSSTLTTCLGNVGTATATVSGGTPAYTYVWSNGGTTSTINNLTVGLYSVTVTDLNSCGVTASVMVNAGSGPRDSIANQVNNLCFGGNNASAFVGVQGGTPPYTYLWTNGQIVATATGLTSGSYTVTVTDAGGCTNTAVAVITNPSMIRDSITSITNNVCANGNTGSATVGVQGGTSPYTYSWTNGAVTPTAIALTSGSYTVTITDNNGCTATASAVITQPTIITDSISSQFNGCIGNSLGNATLGVSGGIPPYTYLWSPGAQTNATATGLTAGTYTVSVHDVNGCTWFLNTTIAPDSVPTVTFNPGADSVVCDSTQNLSLIAFGHPAGGAFTGTTVAAGIFHPHTAGNGTYTITYTYTNGGGCTDSAKHSIRVKNCPLGVTQIDQAANSIVIYPNPTVGQFNVSGLTIGSVLEIYDGIGKLVTTTKADKETMLLNLGDKADGIYLVRVIDKEGVYATQQKVIKLH